MNSDQKQYYYEMAKRDRLLMLYVNGKSEGLLTFFIGNGNARKYTERDNMWSVVDDEPKTGNTCYIDHLLTSKNRDNPYASLYVWRDVKNYIKNNYPLVERIRHNRYKKNWEEPKTFKEGV